MARPSPGAERVVMVLEFLAHHPDQRFTLSELARGCRLNKATAHALLTELTTRGVLLRHPDEKRYSLGPRLVPIGAAAAHGYQVEDFTPGVLRRLAQATGTTAGALARDPLDDRAVLVDQAVGSRARALPERWPLVPPIGAMFFAYSDEPSVEAWLARCPAGGSVHQALGGLEAMRRDGVVIGAAVPAWRRLTALLSSPSATYGADLEHEALREALAELSRSNALVTHVEPNGTYNVAYVAAAVFDHRGDVTLAVVAGGQDERVVTKGSDLRSLAGRVADAADELTEAVSGTHPKP